MQDTSRDTINQQKTKCEKCHEEDVLTEKLQSLRELMEKVEIESMLRMTNLTSQQAKMKIIQDNMYTFKKLIWKTMYCAKESRTSIKKYSRKSTYHSVKSLYAIKSASSAKITYHYAKKCSTLVSKAISVLIRNPVQMSIQQGDANVA